MSLVEFGCVSYEVKKKLQKGVQIPVPAEHELVGYQYTLLALVQYFRQSKHCFYAGSNFAR